MGTEVLQFLDEKVLDHDRDIGQALLFLSRSYHLLLRGTGGEGGGGGGGAELRGQNIQIEGAEYSD